MAGSFTIEEDNGRSGLRFMGDLDLYHVQQARAGLRKARGGDVTTIDVSGLTRLDTVGALLLVQLAGKEGGARLHGLRPEHEALYRLVSKTDVTVPSPPRQSPTAIRLLKRLGMKTHTAVAAGVEIVDFFGHACVSFARSLRRPSHLRISSIVHHIEETGIHAIPIIALIAFLIAIVLGYQGIAQLRPLGGERYTVNLVAISVLREMGVLLTAIMVAGRSGSAFTAEIGVMKVREEVDALQVTGIDPFEVLVMPRLIALIITLPLLTFIADMMGLLGGAVIVNSLINISLPQFMEHVREVAKGHDFMVGMLKAPIFAFLIATTGCLHGMKVSGSAESVGRETTASVVQGIFLVLVADAFFSILFEKIGI